MFGSTILDVAIGLVFVFLMTSLICSAISGKVSEVLNWRAEHLEKYLRELLLENTPANVTLLYNSPFIKAIKPNGKNPISIPAKTFVLAFLDTFMPDASAQAAGNAARNVVSNAQTAGVGVASPQANTDILANMRQMVNALPSNAPMRNTILAIIGKAETDISGVRKNIETLFNTAEEQMTTLYKQKMWQFSLVIGAVVTLLLNIDSVAVVTTLWRDPTLRASIVAEATQVAQKDQPPTATLTDLTNQVNQLGLPIGWTVVYSESVKFERCMIPTNWVGLSWCVGPSDWVNWTPPPSAVQPAPPSQSSSTGTVSPATAPSAQPFFPWVPSFFTKLIGWIATAFAGAQGAPFWFDLLRRLTQAKTGNPTPGETK